MRGKFGYVAGLLEPVCEGEKRGKAGLYAGLLVATESRSGAGFLGGDRFLYGATASNSEEIGCLDFGGRSGDLWTISLKGGRKGRLVFPDGFWHWFDGVEKESGMAGGSGKDGSGWREIWERVEINFIFQGCMESFVFKF
uniref:Uncharacterized protein n=1 Tax=Populus alba TaxID=43335 RepID=A0A4U5QHU8_POPAL|nr:hypothetical protein D5086_0000087800 [Populus alba]